MTIEEIQEYKSLLLGLIPTDGSPKGNVTLLDEFKGNAKKERGVFLTDEDYWDVRNSLISDGRLVKGRGRGGSVYLAHEGAVVSASKPAKKLKESDLYAPFYETISKTWVRENEIKDFISQNTASQGKKKTGGKWTRPDVSLVAVKKFEFIPGTILEVITFEIKPEDEFGVEGVFETAAQSVFAHKSYLAIAVSKTGKPDSEDFSRIERLCERFGIGLLTFSDPADWVTFEEFVTPERKNPDPKDVNSFIQTQIKRENQEKLQLLIK